MDVVHKTIYLLTLFSLALPLVLCELKLTILHTNDMHGRFEDTDAATYKCKSGCFGGFARLKTAVDVAKKEAKNHGREVIFLNAGDTFAGSIFFIRFTSKVVIPMLKSLGIDVMSLGNHEFDGRTTMLADFIEKIGIPVVCSNIDISEEPAFKNKNTENFSASKVLEIGPNKIKVGIVGYLTSTGTENLNLIKMHEEIESIYKEVKKLKKEGVKILIALGHAGYELDQKIAKLVPDLDIVVGGHTDTFLFTGSDLPSTEKPEGLYPTVITQEGSKRKVLVVQTSGYTKYLGNLEVTFDDDGEIIHSQTSGNPILVDSTYEKDPDVTALLKPFWDILIEENVTRTIGHTNVFLAGGDFCLRKECNLGNLIADAFVYGNAVDFESTDGWTDASIGVVNAGEIRQSMDTNKYGGSDLTFLLLSTSLIYTNPVVKVSLSGAEIKEMLEHSVSTMHDPEDVPKQFLQVSGIRVRYDISRPVNKRVVSVRVLCTTCPVPKYERLIAKRKYKIITTRYLAIGHEGYKVLEKAQPYEVITRLNNERHAVEDYMTHVSTFFPAVEGRIRFVNDTQLQDLMWQSADLRKVSSKLTNLITDSIKTEVLDKLPVGHLVEQLSLPDLFVKLAKKQELKKMSVRKRHSRQR